MDVTAGITSQESELSSPRWTSLSFGEFSQLRYDSIPVFRVGFEQQTEREFAHPVSSLFLYVVVGTHNAPSISTLALHRATSNTLGAVDAKLRNPALLPLLLRSGFNSLDVNSLNFIRQLNAVVIRLSAASRTDHSHRTHGKIYGEFWHSDRKYHNRAVVDCRRTRRFASS